MVFFKSTKKVKVTKRGYGFKTREDISKEELLLKVCLGLHVGSLDKSRKEASKYGMNNVMCDQML